MASKFGEWLDPDGRFGRAALSPINHDYSGLAPIYIQAGGSEMLRDMVIEFANVQAEKGAEVMLDLWQDMPHDFQACDTLKPSSIMALRRLTGAIRAYVDEGAPSTPMPHVTVLQNGRSGKPSEF